MNRTSRITIGILLAASSLHAQARYPKPTDRPKTFSVTAGKKIGLPARHTLLPAYVFGDPTGKKDLFTPSGYMGDSAALQLITNKKDPTLPMSADKRARTSLRIKYRPKGSQGWAGVYWQTPPNNWGQRKGAGYDLRRAGRLSFWIRGEKGGEIISMVKVGGISGPYPDSDVATLGPIKLSKEWEEYSVPLEGKDMSHIIGGFAVLFQRRTNPRGATVYVGEVAFRKGEKEPVETAESVQTEETPVSSSTAALKEPLRKRVQFINAAREYKTDRIRELDDILDTATTYSNTVIYLTGYTDDIGSEAMNLKLSRERAKSVAEYLTAHGIPAARIKIDGKGEADPVADNRTPDGRMKNRRVEVRFEEK